MYYHFSQNHLNVVETLRDELEMLSKSKEELEKRLQTSVVEKDTLSASLNECFERIHVLQRQMRTTDNILERLKRENDTLSERLESVC